MEFSEKDPYRPLQVVNDTQEGTFCINCCYVRTVLGEDIDRTEGEGPLAFRRSVRLWYCFAPTGKIDQLTGRGEIVYEDCRGRFDGFENNICPDYMQIPDLPEPEPEPESLAVAQTTPPVTIVQAGAQYLVVMGVVVCVTIIAMMVALVL